ncbi:MAG: hypothetical protein V1908_02435 [Candidatus Peregrinibacteria bacterium]
MINDFDPFHQKLIFIVGLAATTVLTMGIVSFSQMTQDLTFAQNGLAQTFDIMSKRYTLESPDIAMNQKGDIAIVWQEKKGADYDVYALKTHTDKPSLKNPIRANHYTLADQKEPHVAMDAKGNFVVVWTSFKQDGEGAGVFGQRFDFNGNPRGTEFRVNTAAKRSQESPDIAMNAAGNFAVVWTSESGFNKEKRIFLRLYDSSKSKNDREIKADTVEGAIAVAMENPVVALSDEGKTLVAWQTLAEKGDWEIKARAFDSSGTPASPAEVTVNATTKGDQTQPAINPFGTSQFLVAWKKDLKWDKYKDLELVYQNIQAAVLANNGSIARTEFDVEVPTFRVKQDPTVVHLENGAMVLWQEKDKESGSWKLKGQPISTEASQTAQVIELGESKGQPFWEPQTSSDKSEKVGVVWKGKNSKTGKGIIRFQQIEMSVAEAISSNLSNTKPAVN